MWNTTQGQRVLQQSEAKVFKDAALDLVDAIRAEADLDNKVTLDIAVFDNLAWQQKLSMLLRVVRPLLVESCPPPSSSALCEGTVGAVFAHLLEGVEIEIDVQQTSTSSSEGDTDRRISIVQALTQVSPDQRWPDPECVVLEEWELAVSHLQLQVLPDEDWKFADMTLEMPPERANELRAAMGIDSNYSCDIPADIDDRPPAAVWADLIELLAGERPDESCFSTR